MTIVTREQRIRQALADALQSGTPENNISVTRAAPVIGVLTALGFPVIRSYAQPSVSGPLIADGITFDQIRQAGLDELPVNILVHFAGAEEDGHNLARLAQLLTTLATVNDYHRLFNTIYGLETGEGKSPAEHLLELKPVRDTVEQTFAVLKAPALIANQTPALN